MYTQALLNVEEKKQKGRINKLNRYGKRSIISGAYEGANANNVYDLVGNVYDWTCEFYNSYNNRSMRGGFCTTEGTILPAGKSHPNSADYTNSLVGLRCSLYVK